MAGIAGWVDHHRDLTSEVSVISAMTDALRHHGPDAGGSWTSQHALLGHRRLTVTDNEVQSMTVRRSDGHEVVLAYAGQIYNCAELRTDLRQRGQRFTTGGDAEVVLRCYLEWGISAVHRFRGMFAFALWDCAREELLLVRDRLGLTPLFYAQRDGSVLFGSEPRALLANPLLSAEVDMAGLVMLLTWVGEPGMTAYRGIKAVRPGHWLRVTRGGVVERAYWRLESAAHIDDRQTTAARIRTLLTDAVAEQSAVAGGTTPGSLLSGGLDSSTVISALAADTVAERDGKRLSTYSVSLRGERWFDQADEEWLEQAGAYPSVLEKSVREVAAHLGTRHVEIVLDRPDVLSAVPVAMRARDAPGLHILDAIRYRYCDAVRRESAVVLSGLGSEEVFGAHSWFDPVGRPDGFPWRLDSAGLADFFFTPEVRARLDITDRTAQCYAAARAEVPRLPGEEPVQARAREISYLAATRFLPMLLGRDEPMSTAANLQVRLPFCDHRLVEYAFNIPWGMKAGDGPGTGILRQATADLLPDCLLDSSARVTPAQSSPHPLPVVRQRLWELTADREQPLRDLVDLNRIAKVLTSSENRPIGAAMIRTVGTLLAIGWWLKEYRVRVV